MGRFRLRAERLAGTVARGCCRGDRGRPWDSNRLFIFFGWAMGEAVRQDYEHGQKWKS